MPPPDSPRPLAIRFAGLVAAGLVVACASERPKAPPPAKELSAGELRDLLAKGTIKPVTAMEGDVAYQDLDPGMEPLPEAPPASTETEARPEPDTAEPPVNPYLQFGTRIKVYPDGTITKPYPLRVGTGEKLEKLLRDYGNFPLWTPEAGVPSPASMVKIDLLKDWDIELYQNLRELGSASTPTPLADWLVVTSGSDLLQEVEDFLNLFAAGIPQIEI